MPFAVSVISPQVNSFSSKSVFWVNLDLAQECYLPCVCHQSIRSSFTHKFISPEHPNVPSPSNEAEHLADSTSAAEEARAWGTSSEWYAWLESKETDPSSTSSIGPCESHPRTSPGVSPGYFLQHGLWRACTPKLTACDCSVGPCLSLCHVCLGKCTGPGADSRASVFLLITL